MVEKVKVNRKVSKALDSAFKMYDHEEERENAILKHTMRGTWSEEREILHEIEPLELAKILINGYEIEQTPEEILLEAIKSPFTPSGYCNNFNNGVIFATRTLGVEIKGINK